MGEAGNRVNVVVSSDLPLAPLLDRSIRNSERFSLVLCAGDCAQLLLLCERLTPCILFVSDGELAQVDTTALGDYLRFGRRIRAIVVLTAEETLSPQHFLQIGCVGILSVDASETEVDRAMRVVADGEVWAPRKVLSLLLRDLLETNSPQRLTPREVEILSLIAEGRSNREIAEKLFISRETVKWYKRSLNAKLGTRDASSLARREWATTRE